MLTWEEKKREIEQERERGKHSRNIEKEDRKGGKQERGGNNFRSSEGISGSSSKGGNEKENKEN